MPSMCGHTYGLSMAPLVLRLDLLLTLKTHRVLQAGNVSLGEVKSANDVLPKSVHGLEDAELSHFTAHVGNVKHV